MNILKSSIENNQKLSTATLRSIERLVCVHGYTVEDGWRAIIEMQCEGEEHPYFQLDVQSNRSGGDYAEAKMQMLKHFPDLTATGLESPKEFVARLDQHIEQIPPEQLETFKAVKSNIAKLEHIEQMRRCDAESLRDCGLTSYKGAIRVPYETLVSTKHGIDRASGEVRIAFNGAEEWQDTFSKEWQDVFFTMDILADLRQSLNELWEYDQIWFNLRGLEADPQTKMWLNLLGIREA